MGIGKIFEDFSWDALMSLPPTELLALVLLAVLLTAAVAAITVYTVRAVTSRDVFRETLNAGIEIRRHQHQRRPD